MTDKDSKLELYRTYLCDATKHQAFADSTIHPVMMRLQYMGNPWNRCGTLSPLWSQGVVQNTFTAEVSVHRNTRDLAAHCERMLHLLQQELGTEVSRWVFEQIAPEPAVKGKIPHWPDGAVYLNARDYAEIRKYADRDQLDSECGREILRTGRMGTLYSMSLIASRLMDVGELVVTGPSGSFGNIRMALRVEVLPPKPSILIALRYTLDVWFQPTPEMRVTRLIFPWKGLAPQVLDERKGGLSLPLDLLFDFTPD